MAGINAACAEFLRLAGIAYNEHILSAPSFSHGEIDLKLVISDHWPAMLTVQKVGQSYKPRPKPK